MDEQLIQRSRYILKSRVRNVQTSPKYLFPYACQQLLDWVNNHPILKPLTYKLSQVNEFAKEEVVKIVSYIKQNTELKTMNMVVCDNSLEYAALCYYTIKGITELTGLEEYTVYHGIDIFATFLTKEHPDKIEDAIESIRDVAVDGLYEFLDEHLDSRNAIYGLLLKYKQKCEWFNKDILRTIAIDGREGKKGERSLATNLQEYIFDQGVEFMIEPVSSSGEVDLILRSSEGRHIILDAKYIHENSPRSAVVEKLSSGFHQVMRYCEDYNESEGFLVTFLNTNVRVSLELEELDGFPFLTIGSKVIYHLFINICDEPSASKSGKAEEIILKKDELKEEAK